MIPSRALTWTADSRWGVGGAGYHQQQRGRPRRISMHRLPDPPHESLAWVKLCKPIPKKSDPKIVAIRGPLRVSSDSARE